MVSMVISFYIKFTSRFGESLQIIFTGNNDQQPVTYPLEYLDEAYWHGRFQSDMLPDQNLINYSVIYQPAEGSAYPIIINRKVDLKKMKSSSLEIIDHADDPGLYEKVFNTNPFKKI